MNDGLILAIGTGAGIALLLGALVLHLASRRAARRPTRRPDSQEMVVLLRDGEIIDSTTDAAEIFDRPMLQGVQWAEIYPELARRFPDLPEDLGQTELQMIAADDPDTILSVTHTRDVARLSIRSRPINIGQMHRLARDRNKLERLSRVIDIDPNPVWIMSDSEIVLWYNPAYAEICEDAEVDPDESCPFEIALPLARSPRTSRVSLPGREGKRRWFEVQSHPIAEGWLHFAMSIDPLIEAEMAQRNFVQTLTKTFAHLPIGLAVFDRERRLVLFNPALLDLTHLPVDFLSARPNLFSFFDHMRENRMMPEPKNYVSWREKLHDVVSAAREDRYNETWNLPSGLTYRITGRPHPDGAVAFLIEDISAEISLTRRFRSELELTQSVLDCFDDAAAVFSRLGVLTFSNAAYREMWKCDPDGAFAEITIVDTTKDWQRACEPSPIWVELREFVLTMQDRTGWEARLTTTDGKPLRCMIEPVSAGATLVRFMADPGRSEKGLAKKPGSSASIQ